MTNLRNNCSRAVITNSSSITCILLLGTLSACGGSGGISALAPTALDTLQGSLDRASNGDIVTIGSIDGLSNIDLMTIADGVTISIDDGPLTGTQLTTLGTIGSTAGAIRVVSPGDNNTTETSIVATSDLNNWLESALIAGSAPTVEGTGRDDGNFKFFQGRTQSHGGVTFATNGISFSSSDVRVEGNVGEFGGQAGSGTYIGAYREGLVSNSFANLPLGDYTYAGPVVMFADDDSHSSLATIILNFEDEDGSFLAENFLPDNGATPLTMRVRGDLSVDVTNGSFTSTNGIIDAGNANANASINGLLTGNAAGAAGSIVVLEESGIAGVVGGIFAVEHLSVD